MATQPVKHFLSTFAGAPVLNGQAGALIAVLDACLVNGFNLQTLDSLAVAGNVLTGSKAGHGFAVDQVIATTANEAALTGEWTVTSVTSGTFSAAATGVADVAGTGTLTAKAAGAGWGKVFPGTNKAVYRSLDPESTRMYLRIDDTGTTTARVMGYESMTDVDSGVGPFPTEAQVSGGGYWYKSRTADAVARPWVLVADGSGIHFFPWSADPASYPSAVGQFYDFVSEKPGDAYRCALNVHTINGYVNQWPYNTGTRLDNLEDGIAKIFIARSYSQIGGAVIGRTAGNGMGGQYSGSASNSMLYPSPVSNGLVLTKMSLTEAGTELRAAEIPGVYATPQKQPLSHLDKITIPDLPGRTLLTLVVGTSSNVGRLFIDITGPWR